MTTRRSERFDRTAILGEALARLGAGRVAVFDIDSTVLDNRPRQARILREFGESIGDKRIAACRVEYWTGWDLETPMSRSGLSAIEVEQLAPAAKAFWKERFFTSPYCVDDEPIPGAADYLRRVAATGATLCYVTGRHTQMGPGTLTSFERAGFAMPDGARVRLLLKPTFSIPDDDWKRSVPDQLRALGDVVCAFDNEPVHINGYRMDFPKCLAVHLDTDHSGRPVEINPDIPSIPNFVQ